MFHRENSITLFFPCEGDIAKQFVDNLSRLLNQVKRKTSGTAVVI